MLNTKTLVHRLTREIVAGVPVFPTPIELEAADRIRKLEQELLAVIEKLEKSNKAYDKLTAEHARGVLFPVKELNEWG